MNSEPAKSDTGSTNSDPQDSTRSSWNNCWECMADYLSRIWTYISDACCSAWQWFSDLFTCCNCQSSSQSQERINNNNRRRRPGIDVAAKSRTYPQANNQQQTSKPVSPPSQNVSDNQTDTTQPKQKNGSEPTSQPMNPLSKTSSPTSILKNRPQTYASPPKQQQSNNHETTLPEPPKIDFVETGSIFGDRKKTTVDHTMLQIENGRFRSPGLSKVIPGPNGRQIRVSFVSGFPSIKSIESRNSLASAKSWTRRSTESAPNAPISPVINGAAPAQVITPTITIAPAAPSGPAAVQVPPLPVAGGIRSLESLRGKKVPLNAKSVRSIKSVASNESKDGEVSSNEGLPTNKQLT